MKILLISHLFPNKQEPNSGIFNLSRAKALKALGCEVKVIAPVGLTPPASNFYGVPNISGLRKFWRNVKSLPEFEIREGIEVYYPKWAWLPRKLFWGFDAEFLHMFAGNEIQKIISQFSPDAVLSSFISPGAAYAKYIKKNNHNIQYLSIIDGSDINYAPFKFRGIRRILKTIDQHVDKVIFVSKSLQEQALRTFDIKSSVVIHNGFDTNLFYYDGSLRNSIQNKIHLVSVGGLNPAKGHDILLRALIDLDRRFTLSIVGAGELETTYRDYIVKNNLSQRVNLLGSLDHARMRSVLAQAEIFCMPSRSEGLPSAPLEAMGCGLPVVASSIGALTEIVREGFNGFIFKKEDSADLSEKILKAAQVKWDRESISRWARDNYSWDRWAREILELVDNELAVK